MSMLPLTPTQALAQNQEMISEWHKELILHSCVPYCMLMLDKNMQVNIFCSEKVQMYDLCHKLKQKADNIEAKNPGVVYVQNVNDNTPKTLKHKQAQLAEWAKECKQYRNMAYLLLLVDPLHRLLMLHTAAFDSEACARQLRYVAQNIEDGVYRPAKQ